jgi:flagellar FliJ protein
MSQPSVLITLIEIATKELELQTEQLGRATKVLDDAHAQAKMLRQYRQDYVDKLQNSMLVGLSKEGYQNYQNFLYKLDQAINGQDELVAHAERSLKVQREKWQDAQRKKLSYEVLVSRSEVKAHKLELKRDQKMMDEYAMRSKSKQTK